MDKRRLRYGALTFLPGIRSAQSSNVGLRIVNGHTHTHTITHTHQTGGWAIQGQEIRRQKTKTKERRKERNYESMCDSSIEERKTTESATLKSIKEIERDKKV